MAEEKQIVFETQAELDEVITNRLDRAKAKWNEQEEGYKKKIAELESNIKANETKYQEQDQKLKSHDDVVAQLNAELSKSKLQGLKHKIAHESGLPFELAERLSGSDEDAIRQDAEALKKYVAKPQPLPLRSVEPTPSEAGNTYDKALADFSKKLSEK